MQLRSIFYGIRGWSYPNRGITRKCFLPNSLKAVPDSNVEMTFHMVKRSRATTSCHLQTGRHPPATAISVQNVVTWLTGKGSHVRQKSTSARYVISLGISPANVSRRNSIGQTICRQPKAHQIQVDGSRSYIYDGSSESSSTEDSFCLQVKIQQQNRKSQQMSHTTHLTTNIAYRLKPHHHRNKYL